MTPQSAWDAAYHQLELQLDRASFDTWMRGARFLSHEGETYVVGVSNGYARDMLQHRLYKNIRKVLSDVVGGDCEIRFELSKDNEEDTKPPAGPLLFNFEKPPEQQPETVPDQPGEAAEERSVPDEWHFFAMLPKAVVTDKQMNVALLGTLAKIIMEMHLKRNVLIRNLEQMAELCGVSESSVRRYTGALQKAGYLHIISGGGKGKANTYRLAGMLAVRLCGRPLNVAEQVETEADAAPDQPENGAETGENDAPIPVQIEQVSDETTPAEAAKGVKLNGQNDKGCQIEHVSPVKPVQIEHPIKIIKSFLDKKDPDAEARAHARGDQGAAADAVDGFEKINYPRRDVEDKKQQPRGMPQHMILHEWVMHFEMPSDEQVKRLRALADCYDVAAVDAAIKVVKVLAKSNNKFDPVAKLEQVLGSRASPGVREMSP